MFYQNDKTHNKHIISIIAVIIITIIDITSNIIIISLLLLSCDVIANALTKSLINI